jgi:hypothetical protein
MEKKIINGLYVSRTKVNLFKGQQQKLFGIRSLIVRG